jgi:hypothetical protein
VFDQPEATFVSFKTSCSFVALPEELVPTLEHGGVVASPRNNGSHHRSRFAWRDRLVRASVSILGTRSALSVANCYNGRYKTHLSLLMSDLLAIGAKPSNAGSARYTSGARSAGYGARSALSRGPHGLRMHSDVGLQARGLMLPSSGPESVQRRPPLGAHRASSIAPLGLVQWPQNDAGDQSALST